jgi:hypothetical protein
MPLALKLICLIFSIRGLDLQDRFQGEKGQDVLKINQTENRDMKYEKGNATEGLFIFIFAFVGFAAWITHIFVCLSDEAWRFLIAGAIMFPIAIIHGIGLWFGFF